MGKPLFIAEIGLNHSGSLDKAKRMIDKSKKAGAAIAKFQFYRPIDILGLDSPYLAEATQAYFTKHQHEELAFYCEQVDIEYLVSVFDTKDIEWADTLCKRHKVATRVNTWFSFIEKLKSTGKQVICSIQKETKQLSGLDFMWCVPKYPTIKKEAIDFKFDDKHGLSSHCPDITASIEAYKLGASIFENHVCENTNEVGCDIPASIDFNDYAKLIKSIS